MDTSYLRSYRSNSKIPTGINDEHYNVIIVLFIIIMNRFFQGLYKRKFVNERQRMRNMLILLDLIVNPVAHTLIPTAISILECQTFTSLDKFAYHELEKFEEGNEHNLVEYLLNCEIEGMSVHKRRQLKLNICTSSIAVMNCVSATIFSKKIKEAMYKPCLQIRDHL